MRELNDLEKEICKQIGNKNSGDNIFLSNIIYSEFSNIYIKITREPLKAEMLIFIDLSGDEIKKKIDEVSYYILNVVNLIKLLEKKNYILTINKVTNPSKEIRYGHKFSNSELDAIRYELPDENIVGFLLDFYDKEIYPTKELESFINRGFVSRNQKRHDQQYKVSLFALAITSVALFISTCSSLISRVDKNITRENNVPFEKQKDTIMSKEIDSLPMIHTRGDSIVIDTSSIKTKLPMQQIKDKS